MVDGAASVAVTPDEWRKKLDEASKSSLEAWKEQNTNEAAVMNTACRTQVRSHAEMANKSVKDLEASLLKMD